jgi:hypothetical protein
MADLTIVSAEVFACKSDAPQIIWAKDMSPMFEANVIVKLQTQSGIEAVGGASDLQANTSADTIVKSAIFKKNY